ncbi:hypothetical protein BDC45DRAFT_568837 [Circinella umbellata]|nr:hypothetical protein BDC45DRAFT_568837 [Circinella umbellata]
MVTLTQNKLSFNNDKIVIDINKLQSLLTKHSIDVISFCKEETVHEKKATEKQKAASKASLKSANTKRTMESEEKNSSENRDSEENSNSQENVNSEDKSPKNKDSQES